jgi:hypothetical protein
MQDIPGRAVLCRAALAKVLVAEAIDDKIPDGLELFDHHVFTQRNPDVVNNQGSKMKISEVEIRRPAPALGG